MAESICFQVLTVINSKVTKVVIQEYAKPTYFGFMVCSVLQFTYNIQDGLMYFYVVYFSLHSSLYVVYFSLHIMYFFSMDAK